MLLLTAASRPALAQGHHDSGTDGLLIDVERIVGAEESSGWFNDRDALEALEPALLQSVCRATPEARLEARERLDAAARSAGNPRELFSRAGRKLDDAAETALTAERRLRALEHTMARADTECPFFVDPDPAFQGRQTDRNRFTLNLETGGMLQLRQHAGRWTYGGGGAGRLLGAYGFGGRFTLLAGPEFGGGAMLESGESGKSAFVINYFPAVPVVARWHVGAWHWDAEVAPVSWFQASDTSFSFGGRAGLSVGVAALRTRGVIPWAGAALAYEHFVPSGGRERAHFLRGGLRVGVVWDGR